MASVHQDPRTGNWIVSFRYGGRQFNRSCETSKKSDAILQRGRVNETIRLLKTGRIAMPSDADPALWIISEGRLKTKPDLTRNSLSAIGEICDAYLDTQMSKAETTLESERVHIRHFKRVMGERRALSSTTLDDLQQYVKERHAEKRRGKQTSGKTIRKELATFRQIWDWAQRRGIVAKPCPVYGEGRKWVVSIPKSKERPKFQTWEQIERELRRGGLSAQQEAELWDSLFLDEDRIQELLTFVEKKAPYPFIYPMYVFAAYTGARRSEICRSRITDFDFEHGEIKIRERKRRKDMAESYRIVPMHHRLAKAMKTWLGQHPGGQHTIAMPLKVPRRRPKQDFLPLTRHEAHHHFKHVLRDSKWRVIKGFHVLRHSFGSNLARTGRIQRETIAEWMGHTTEEMKALYQHLFPQDGHAQINVLK